MAGGLRIRRVMRGLVFAPIAFVIACSLALPGEDDLGGGVCAEPRRVCGNACVDPTTSVQHCGGCGNACAAGETCSSGRCATTRYLAPTGDDANPGTEDRPWKTFDFAFSQLAAGSVLVLEDGSYRPDVNGRAVVQCGSKAVDGSSERPIRVVARNERRARIASDGGAAAVSISGCQNWHFEGLHVTSMDATGTTELAVVDVTDSVGIVLSRLLVENANRWAPQHAMIALTRVSASIVEESEIYNFHYDAIRVTAGPNIVRRNYVNSNGAAYPALEGGPPGYTQGIYVEGRNVTIENNVVERVRAAFGTGSSDGVKFFGNVALETEFGFWTIAWGTEPRFMAIGTLFENDVSVAGLASFSIRSPKAARLGHCTAIGGEVAYGIDDDVDRPGDGQWSFAGEDAVAVSSSNYGYYLGFAGAKLTRSRDFAATNALYTEDPSQVSDVAVEDPKLGTCRLRIPADSPLKGKGAGGTDIGANVVYQTDQNVSTNIPLWRPEQGYRFAGCGAEVEGSVNAGATSCRDVHRRLAVGAVEGGCAMPY